SRLDWQRLAYDNGTSLSYDWDPAGLADWSLVTSFFDAQSRLDWQQIVRDNGAWILNGGEGSNELNGGVGDDTLDGGASDDILRGGFGNDSISGGVGNDTISGNAGSDTVNGGAGNDSFIFNSPLGSNNDDLILSYNAFEDTILLDQSVFGAIGAAGSPLAAGSFTVNSVATSTDHRIVFDNATGALFYDADGSGAGSAVHFATLTGISGSITYAEFLII
ncbi:MAG: calcium-binding protein, partial [Acetobacteraceae bacterium]